MSSVHDDPQWPSRRRPPETNVSSEPTAQESTEGSPTPDEPLPPIPATAEETGLDFGVLTDLALKTVYADTSCTTQRAAERLALPVGVVDTVLQHLYREHFIEIRETITLQNR